MVVAHGAVPLSSSNHKVYDVDHVGTADLHLHHIETLAGQIVTWYEGSPLAFGEGAGLTTQGGREEEDEEERAGGEHCRTEKTEDRYRMLSVPLNRARMKYCICCTSGFVFSVIHPSKVRTHILGII